METKYYDIILAPVISERSMGGADEKRYVFKVHPDAKKIEIKQAIEKIFDVKVKKINTANYQGKLKRQGRYMGRRSSYKKAIITLSKDSKALEIFEGL